MRVAASTSTFGMFFKRGLDIYLENSYTSLVVKKTLLGRTLAIYGISVLA